jgi:long-chain acyl-CoA synthetase
MKTLLELAEKGYPKNEQNIAMACKRNDEWIETSVDDFRKSADRLAMGLYELGIRKGDRVGLHAENSTEWVMTDVATLSLGAILVPIYVTQPGDQIKFILGDSGAKVFLVSNEKLFSAFAPFVDELPDMQLVGIHGVFHDRMMSMSDVIQMGRDAIKANHDALPALKAAVQPGDLASFIYTSGTTGMPKGVMLTHDNIASNIEAILDKGMFLNPDDHRDGRVLSYLPLSHIFERVMAHIALHTGVPMYFIPNIDSFLADIQAVKPVHFTTVPRLLEKVYHGIQTKIEAGTGLKGKIGKWAFAKANSYVTGQPRDGFTFKLADKLVYSKLRDLFGGNLVGITSGGAALPSKLMNFMNAIGIPTAQGYGLTETSPVITMYDRNKLKEGSAGVVIKGLEVKLIPVEGGEGTEGEIVIKGPNVMKGYYNNPTATTEVLTEDGWFHTGDIGKFVDDNLYITDRKKELLKLSTGKYIAPAPIENDLVLSSFIEQVVVIGNGQKFCSALIVPSVDPIISALKKQGVTVTAEQVSTSPEAKKLLMDEVKRANQGVAPWEQIKDFRILPTPFSIEGGELTPSLKLKRRIVQEKYKDDIASMY